MTKVSRGQLLLPMLEALRDAGGTMKASDVCDSVAASLKVSAEERQRTLTSQGRHHNLFDRRCYTSHTAHNM